MLSSTKTRSLSHQIAIYIIFFVLLIALTMIVVTRYLMSNVMMDNAQSFVESITGQNIHRIEAKLSKAEIIARNLAYLLQNSLINEVELTPLLSSLLKTNPEISSVVIVYEEPAPRSYEPALYCLENGNLTSYKMDFSQVKFRDWYSVSKYSGDWRWSEPWLSDLGNSKLISSLSVPLTINGRFVGILRLDLDVNSLQELVSLKEQHERGQVFLITNNGVFLAHPADSLLMNYSIFALAEAYDYPRLRDLGNYMLQGRTGFEQLHHNGPLKDKWLAYAPLKTNGWAIGVLVDHWEIFSELYRLNLIQALVSVLALLVLFSIIMIKVRQINRPLTELCDAAELLGKGNFDIQITPSHSYSEVENLSNTFVRMQQSLKTYIRDLNITQTEKDKILTEVNFASTIQHNLIPNIGKEYSYKDCIKVFGIFDPAGDIGGDLYDYFTKSDHKFCFVIADVTGKGIVASMTMTMVSTFLRAKAEHHANPGNLLEDLNRYLCDNNLEENFVTAIFGCIDLQTGMMKYANAGHVPFFVRSKDCSYVKYAETQSTALGFFRDLNIPYAEIQLDLGDELILVTDGITEAMSSDESFFGISRLEDIVKGLQNPHPETTAKAIKTAAGQFSNTAEQNDDITILVIEFVHPIPH